MLVYVSRHYREEEGEDITLQIIRALHKKAHTVAAPIYIEEGSNVTKALWNLTLLMRCDAMVVPPTWSGDEGIRTETKYAEDMGIPIYVFPDIPDRHPTELMSPKQATGFMMAIMSMYRTHLEKNADYSPANILATGEIGLITRLWDKTARLMNLSGFRIKISDASYEVPRNPKNESIDDSLIDLAVYAIIGLLLRQGLWGI